MKGQKNKLISRRFSHSKRRPSAHHF